jgi:predicted ATPase/DNA-binding SARP family transcriptional activator
MPVDLPSGVSISYRRQYRRCGNAACLVCGAGGRGHGPYWYAFWREAGRARSRYLGKNLPAGTDTPVSPSVPTATSARAHGPADLRVRTLGGFAVYRGEQLPNALWGRRKYVALFKWLLAAPDHRLTRDTACDLFWPDADPASGSANLRVLVYRLRKALGEQEQSCLRYDGEILSLLPPSLSGTADWLDADRFTRMAHRALASEDLHACRQALTAYDGEYLPEDVYDEWAVRRREELQQLRQALLLHLVTLCRRAGHDEEAEQHLRTLLATDRCHEEAALALMRLHVAGHRPAQAIRVYRRLANALRDELDLEPEDRIQALYRTVSTERTTAAPDPALAERSTPTNLPTPLTSFIGRRSEVAAIATLLRGRTADAADGASPDQFPPCRLVTLTGVGGCGKTRLALQVADELLDGFQDGIWFVDLAPLNEPSLLGGAVARVLGVRETPDQPLIETIVEALRSKHLLLILDNCEHLIEASASLAITLLQCCPTVYILATSRTRLDVAGEQTWPVPPLSPPAVGEATAARLARSEAARLFMDRARAHSPDRVLADQHAACIAQICTRLAGIPLAIELAAARTGVLTVEQIAARLDESLRLLTGGPRTALPRQRTLRATLDWSWNLLEGREQSLLRRLSVFAGGCELTAAERVCAGVGIEVVDVLDLLDGLAGKSLLQVEAQGGEARYGLLETVRRYGLERLKESNEEETIRWAHTAYFLALAEQAEPYLTGRDQGVWLERLTAQHDNLRAALGWARQYEGRVEGLRLAAALWRFWQARGHLIEGRMWLEGLLSNAIGGDPDEVVPLRARALLGAGMLAWSQADYARAAACYEESLALFSRIEDRAGIAQALNNLGNVAWNQDDYGRARELYGVSLRLRRELGDREGMAATLNNLGNLIAVSLGDYGQGTALLEEALALFRAAGDRLNSAYLLTNLGVMARNQGDLGRASALQEECLVIQRDLGNTTGVAYALVNLGNLAAAAMDHERAAALHEESKRLFTELADQGGIAHAVTNLADVARRLGNLDRAAALYLESLTLLDAVGHKRGIASCLEGLATVAGTRGDVTRAACLFGAAAALRDAVRAPHSPADRIAYDCAVDVVRTALGEAFETAWASGATMAWEHVCQLAYAMGPDSGVAMPAVP